MKKILIVNNNMDIGGIQKSLISLLKATSCEYDITLLLFSKSGTLLKEIPNNVKIITPNRIYKILGMSKKQLSKHPFLFSSKAVFIFIAFLFSRRTAMKLLGLFQKKYKDYDCIISYSHLTNSKKFNNGCGDFVIDKTESDNKICMIHCDYEKSGFCSEENNKEYMEFNKIVCCSESVRDKFLKQSKIGDEKVFVLRNFYDFDIRNLSVVDPYIYDENYINLLTIARLSIEKGISEFLKNLYNSKRKDIKYYIIGDGPLKEILEDLIQKYQLNDKVYLIGEVENPYRYIKNIDYVVLPSIHEAAPIVFDEANLLDIPIISTETLSAKEMINNGIIDNDLLKVLKNLKKDFNKTKSNKMDNDENLTRFKKIIGGNNDEK